MQKPITVNLDNMAWQAHPSIAGIKTKFVANEAAFSPTDMLIAEVAVGGDIPWHVHDNESEIAYILQGHGILQYKESEEAEQAATETLEPGVALAVPPRLWHSVTNTGEEAMLILAFHTP